VAADDRSLGLRLGAAALLAPALLVPLALIAAFVAGHWAPLYELDGTVTNAMHEFAESHPLWVEFMALISWVFAPTSLRVAALVLVIWLVWRRRAPRPAVWVVVTMTLGGALSALLKQLVGRHRPDLLEPVARATGYAFPSGHAANAALAAGVFLLVLLPLVHDHPGRRAALWVAATVMPLLTGLSRVALGVHWMSDVVAGWLLGVATVAVTTVAFQGWRTRSGHTAEPVTTEGIEPGLADDPTRRV